jgi:hypothetical protein
MGASCPAYTDPAYKKQSVIIFKKNVFIDKPPIISIDTKIAL